MVILRRVFIVLVALSCSALGYDRLTMASYSGPVSERFDGRRFISPGFAKKKPLDLLKWGLNRNTGPWQQRSQPTTPQPVAREHDDLRITLINHSTVLIQMAGLNLLTDPIWSTHAGPFGKIGPKRFRPAGLRMEELPPIDAVLVSHSHYDHMDLPTLAALQARFDPVFIVGLGNRGNLAKVDITRVVELDWWESHALASGTEILATPAAHWSKRTALDTNRTLWLSFAIRHHGQHRVYFGGDSGYGKHFNAIRERAGAPQIALLPIGAYLPVWFMQDNHLSPVEALTAATDLQSRVMIPVHFGTFALGDDGQDQPVAELLAAKHDGAAQPIQLLDNGQSYTLPRSRQVHHDPNTTSSASQSNDPAASLDRPCLEERQRAQSHCNGTE